jgi:hypothetical protein
MHVAVLDALYGGKTLYTGSVRVHPNGTVRVRADLAGRVVSFDETASTEENDSETLDYLCDTRFVVLEGGVAHPVRAHRTVETEHAVLSLLETPTGWVPHRLVVDTYAGWTPTSDLLWQLVRTEFPDAQARDLASVRMTRRDHPGKTFFALRAPRVFSLR